VAEICEEQSQEETLR